MANFDTYGGLYNWYAASDARNIAASGWKVPAFADFETLSGYLGGNTVSGGKLKITGTTYWTTPNTGATNISQFSALGGGLRSSPAGAFSELLNRAYFWCADAWGASDGYISYLLYSSAQFYTTNAGVVIYTMPKIVGASIRLIKESTTLEDGQFGTYTGNDGTVYDTICIGTQEWMAENLRETKWRTGASIAVMTDATAWAALTSSAMTAYENDGVTNTGPEPESPSPATYGTRYIMPFMSGYGRQYHVYIKELDYTGESEEITGAIIPADRELKGENDVLEDRIFRSVVKISLDCTEDGKFRDLFTANWKRFLVEIYRDSVITWVGFLTTDYYTEPWSAAPYTVTVEAHDGLGQLKNIDFLNSLDQEFTGKITLAEIVGNCLYKILPFTVLYEGINIIEEHQGAGVSLLNHIAVQAERFYMNGTMTCYEALDEVMKICNAQIFQQDSLWWIVSIGNRGDSFTRNRMAITATYTAGLLTTEWVVESSDTFNPIENIDGPTGDVYWWETPQLTKLPGWKQFTVHQDLGLKESMFDPTNFIDLVTSNYEEHDAGTTVPFTYFDSPRRGDYEFSEYTVTLKNTTDGALRFSLGYFEQSRSQRMRLDLNLYDKIFESFVALSPATTTFKFRLILIDGGTTYYLNSSGSWITSAADTHIMVYRDDYGHTGSDIVGIDTKSIPASGFIFLDVIVELFGPDQLITMLLDSSAIKLTMTGFSIPEFFEMTTHIDPDQNYIPDTLEMMFGDFIDVENNVRMYAGGLWYVAGVGSYGVTVNWHTTDDSTEKPLINLIADEISVLHAYSTWMLSGQIRGLLKPVHALYDAHAGRRFIMKRFAENMYTDEWDVDLIEVSRDLLTLVTEDGTEILTDDGLNIGV